MEQIFELILREAEANPAPTQLISSADSNASTSHPDPSFCPCVHELFREAPDSVYRFRQKEKNESAPGRWSFNELVAQWQNASDEKKRDHGSFPDIRKANSVLVNPFVECMLCCACEECESRDEKPLRCRPCKFGDKGEEVSFAEAR